MTTYQKIFGILFVSILIIIISLLIWGVSTSDNNEIIDQTIRNSDTTNVKEILILPYNVDWNINLTLDSVICTEKKDIDELIKDLQNMSEKHCPKGIKSFWDCNLILKFNKTFNNNLKNKERLVFHIFDTEDGIFIEKLNVTGYKTYTSKNLKLKLEKLTDYHFPVGRKK